jgi:2'-5' RNA ligase
MSSGSSWPGRSLGGGALRRLRASPLARLARRGARAAPRQSSLLLEVPAAEPLLRAARLPTHQQGLGPHVTILYPFLPPASLTPEVNERLAAICQQHAPMHLRFAHVGRFPSHAILPVLSADDCVGLTTDIVDAWPEVPPYGGAFATVIPHLTLANRHLDSPEQARVETHLPLETVVTELTCMVNPGDGWRPIWRLPFSV